MKNQVIDPRGGLGVRVSEGDLARALGLQAWSYDPALFAAASAPTAGTRYAVATYLKKGQVINSLTFDVAVAGVGAPTSIFCGICDERVMLAVTGDVKASTIWTAAGNTIPNPGAPLTAPYEVPSSGLYYICFLQVGAWVTTQMTLNRTSGAHNIGTKLAQATFGTAQTVLPNVGSAVTLSGSSALRFFAAASPS